MAPNFDDGDSLYNFVVRDGNGVKGMVDLGLEKVPEQYIQPHHERIDKLKASSYDRPPIDLSMLDGPQYCQVVGLIAEAAEKVGFFQISVKSAAHEFFGQAPEKKAVYRKGVSPSPYVKYGTSFVSMVYTSDGEALEFWPNECKEVALEFLKASISMVRRILEVLMEKLGVTLEESRIDGLIGLKMFNMNFYPTCPNPDLTVGVGRHSDMGTLTVLLQDGIGGLYVKMEEDITGAGKKGEWVEIPPIPGALVINVGDTLQILSNGKYKSAEHRVRTTSTQSRVSIPIFTIPRPNEKIGPLPQVVERDGVAHYREVVFEEYMNNFLGTLMKEEVTRFCSDQFLLKQRIIAYTLLWFCFAWLFIRN
ncbi:hypothetical protein AAG906_029163 [Vitis piasezkii]